MTHLPLAQSFRVEIMHADRAVRHAALLKELLKTLFCAENRAHLQVRVEQVSVVQSLGGRWKRWAEPDWLMFRA